jgi:hypothetical protein
MAFMTAVRSSSKSLTGLLMVLERFQIGLKGCFQKG